MNTIKFSFVTFCDGLGLMVKRWSWSK